MHKVHESIALDQRINVSFEEFPTVWWGPPHTANMCYVKELRYSGGPNDDSSFMRIHQTRLQALNGGMAYGVYPSVTQGDIVTFSFWAKSSVVRNFSWSAYFGGGFQGASGTIQATKEWQRFEYTWTASNTFGFYIYFWPSSPGSLPYFVDLADLQAEVNKGHATPFTLSERTAEEGLKDLTGNSIIDLTNVSFDSNAQMTFDGTSDSVLVGTVGGYSNNMTVEAVFKTSSSATWKNILCGSTGDIIFTVNGAKLNFGSQGSTPIPHANYSVTDVNDGQWHHGVATYNGVQVKIYVDGVLESTNPRSGNQTPSSLRVGSNNAGSSEFFNGDLPFVKLYNRALTASEIQSNYNAIKGRFNI